MKKVFIFMALLFSFSAWAVPNWVVVLDAIDGEGLEIDANSLSINKHVGTIDVRAKTSGTNNAYPRYKYMISKRDCLLGHGNLWLIDSLKHYLPEYTPFSNLRNDFPSHAAKTICSLMSAKIKK